MPLLARHSNTYGQKGELPVLFPLSTPEQQGIRSAVLDSMLLFIKNTGQNIHHLTIIRNDQTVLDADIYPYTSKNIHDLASVTKSFTSLLIGIAIDMGFIKSENERVLQYFPEITPRSQLMDSLKIKDLVTMTAGFACSASGGEKALSDMRKTTDWVKFIFDLPMTSRPGESFSYCSCNFYLLGEIIYRTTNMTPHQFAEKYLFSPLQITDSKWLTNYKGMNHGWGDLFLSPADMAKVGKLILEKGKWQNRQVLSAQWINKSLKTFSRLPEDKGYGYGWWTNDKMGYYEAAGRGRQTISVIPAKNMIVTMLGGEFDAGTIGKYIFRAIESDKSLPASPNELSKLKTTLGEIALPPNYQFAPANDSVIQNLNKRTIVFEKNITGIDSLQFFFSSKENGTVVFYRDSGKEKYPFALSKNRYALSIESTLHLPVALQATADNAHQFILHYNQLCRINNFYFYFTIQGNGIETRLEETTNSIRTSIASSFR